MKKTIKTLRVHCHPSSCWLVLVCQKTRFVSSTAVQYRVNQGECVLSRVHWSQLCLQPAIWNCERRSGSVYHPRVQNPSLRCTLMMGLIPVCVPGMSETCACSKKEQNGINMDKEEHAVWPGGFRPVLATN